jgi:hypothetical protein
MAIPHKTCEIKRRESCVKINFKAQKLTGSFCDLELSHVEYSVEIRNMEDRHFYVGCNWTSEENDLLKVMLMTSQCQTVCWEKNKERQNGEGTYCAQLEFMRKKILCQRENFLGPQKCKCGELYLWLDYTLVSILSLVQANHAVFLKALSTCTTLLC